MPEKAAVPGEDRETLPSDGGSVSRASKRVRKGLVAVSLILALGLILFFGPQWLARYLIAEQLEELGITHEGIDTLEINPWTGEAWLGPVRLGSGPSESAQLEQLGLRIRYNPLMQRRVSVERLLLRGVDVYATRGTDGVITLNGVPVDLLVPPPAAEEPPPDRAEPWGAGLDALELQGSRLIFEDRERGDVAVEIERLTVADVRTWQPDRPGRFELVAAVNDIQLNWSGEARPFADKITLAIDSKTRQADVPKVVRFTGPIGLDRSDGTYDATLRYELALTKEGRVEGNTRGTIEIAGADYRRAGVFDLAFTRASLDLDVAFIFGESGDFSLRGNIVVDVVENSSRAAERTSFGVRSGRIALRELDAALSAGGGFRVAAEPDVDLEGVTFSGPIEISVDRVLELLVLLQSLSAGGEVSSAVTGLGDYAGNSVAIPSSDVTLARLRSGDGSLALRSDDGNVELSLRANTQMSDLRIGIDEREIRVERLQSVLDRFDLASGKGELRLDLKGSNSLAGGSSVSPIGELKVAALENKARAFGLQVRSGAVAAQLAWTSRANGVSARINPRHGLPAAQLQLAAANAVLDEAALDALGGALRWRLAGGAAIDSLRADVGAGEQAAISFERAELKALRANEQLQLSADAFTLAGLDLFLKRSLLQALHGDGEKDADGPSPQSATSSAEAQAPAIGEVDLRRVQALLTELGYAAGTVDGRMGPRTAGAIRAFQGSEGLAVDGYPSPTLLAALEARAAGGAAAVNGLPPESLSSSTSGAAIRIGELDLTGNSQVRFRDDVVAPNVKIDTVFEAARLRNLDTHKTKQRTDVHIRAKVNEFTAIEISGWSRGFAKDADLELQAKVENLELSNFSPYIEKLAGVYLESGRLNSDSSGKASAGDLQGEIQLGMEKIALRPLSEEDAKRVGEQVGVPLDAALSLLQDNEGRIALKLPVSGSLGKPDVDISSAVSKAIGGALKKVFPPTMVASLLSGVSQGSGSLKPVLFAAGSAAFDQAGQRYANDLAKLLAERPRLSLRICGRATAQDRVEFAGSAEPAAEGQSAKLVQRLEELADERGRAVRRYLINGKGIDTDRVGECRSSFDAADQGEPRVQISL